MAVLVGLLVIAPRPGEASPLVPRQAGWAAAAMLVASQSFGTGAAVAMVFPVVGMLLRPGTLRVPASRAILVAVPVTVLLAWLLMNSMRTRLNPGGVETTLALARLVNDLGLVARVTVHLAGMGVADLLLGAAVPLSDFGGTTSLVAIAAFVVAVAGALVLGRGPSGRAMLACLVAVGACYLSVAAGRAAGYLLFSRGRLLEMLAMATRYHYLAQSALAVLFALALHELGRRTPWPARANAVLLGAWTLCAVLSPLLFTPREPRRGDGARLRIRQIRYQMEGEIRSRPPGTTVCLPVEPAPIAYGFPGTVGVFVLYHPSDDFEGRRIRFVSADPTLLALRESGGRMRELLLPEGACPPHDGVSE
jgi:hypothetical protein